jgi:hypothetical protein
MEIVVCCIASVVSVIFVGGALVVIGFGLFAQT